MARMWLAQRVNGRWPHVASILLLGLEGYLASLQAQVAGATEAAQMALEAQEDEAPSRGKVGSRPEDLPDGLGGPSDPYGFSARGRGGW